MRTQVVIGYASHTLSIQYYRTDGSGGSCFGKNTKLSCQSCEALPRLQTKTREASKQRHGHFPPSPPPYSNTVRNPTTVPIRRGLGNLRGAYFLSMQSVWRRGGDCRNRLPCLNEQRRNIAARIGRRKPDLFKGSSESLSGMKRGGPRLNLMWPRCRTIIIAEEDNVGRARGDRVKGSEK